MLHVLSPGLICLHIFSLSHLLKKNNKFPRARSCARYYFILLQKIFAIIRYDYLSDYVTYTCKRSMFNLLVIRPRFIQSE